AGVVVNSHHFGAVLMEQPGSRTANVAKPLYGNPRTVDGDARITHGFRCHNKHTATRRLHAAKAAANADGLTGDHPRRCNADIHGVGVHHPGHGLGIGVDVGGGDVVHGANDQADFADVTTGDALEFALRVLSGVNSDAPFGTA